MKEALATIKTCSVMLLILITILVLGVYFEHNTHLNANDNCPHDVIQPVCAKCDRVVVNDPNEGQLRVTQIGEDEYGKKYNYEIFDSNEWIILK